MAGKNRNTFEKMQREMEKKRKAASKRERRRLKKSDELPQSATGSASTNVESTEEATE